jgi:hypothetical protein
VLKATRRGRKTVERALGPLHAQLAELSQTWERDHQAIIASLTEQVTALIVQHAKAARPRPTRRVIARAAAP